MSKQYTYSTDEEIYHGTFNSAEEAIDASVAEVGSTVWVGEAVPNTAPQFVPALDYLLEMIEESACDECGESAESWLVGLSSTSVQELQTALDAFSETLQRVAPPMFFQVRNVVEHVITDTQP